MRVGILTGGGDCPGLNAVIRSVAKALILQHGADVIGFKDGFKGVVERRYTELGYKDVSGILTRGGTILGTHNKANPFNYFNRDGADVSDEVMDFYRDLELDAVVAIGGDGTMSICHRLQEKGMNVVGVPKTIDNDVMHTDQTFGFDTAVHIATDAIDRLHTTGQSHNRVMILETMGRYSGWIALKAGIAGGADVICIPEIPYEIEEIARVCQEREDRQKFTIIAVAEGAHPKGGDMTVRERIDDSPDAIRLGGVGNRIREDLKPMLESEIRTTVLGHIQRGGTPTAYDRTLATHFGTYAASLVAQGRYDRMVALQNNDITSVSLSEVANKNRKVPMDSMMVASALAVGTSFGNQEVEMDLAKLGERVSRG
jgi:6-phosphofructokinase 1